MRSLSIEATPSAVLISVGQSEQSVTVTAEITSDLGNAPLASTYTADTTIVTIGSQASGETGLNSCTNGLIAPLIVRLRPDAMPSGSATMAARTKPRPTVLSEVRIWSMKVGRPA